MQDIIPPEYTRITSILSIFQNFSHVPVERLKKAQETGTVIHTAIESFFDGNFSPISSKYEGYFSSFLKWVESFQPEVVETEQRLFDDQMMITGQIDLLANIYGGNYLVDFKTGFSSHPEIWELQLTFYRYLLEVNNYIDLPSSLIIVHLKREGDSPDIYEFKYNSDVLKVCKSAWACYKHFEKIVVK